MMEYEAVIGLEVHVQLKTRSKMFSRSAYRYGEAPNTLTDPVVMGLPGALPVMNHEAILQAVRVGLLFGSKIAPVCKWDRKNYFYPDNPKNYQISQYDQPLCNGGTVEIELPGSSRNIMGSHQEVHLTRAHLEEDVGKLTHFANESAIDFNRAGTPLLEIVTEPNLFNLEEVVAFLTALKQALVYAGVSDCDMEKGQMRCDANVSIRPSGDKNLGTRTEMKNLNSISETKACIDFEIKRQTKVIKGGGAITQETRRWDAAGGFTVPMRGKEEAHDYRYFPDPDLMPVKIAAETIERLSQTLPELPFDKQRRFMEDYQLPFTVTSVLCPDKNLSDFYEKAVGVYNKPKEIANFIANDLLRELSASGEEGTLPLTECKISPDHIAKLVKIIDEGIISKQMAKDVFVEMFQTGALPEGIVESKGLKQSTDTGEIEAICTQIITDNPKPVAEFKSGKEAAINRLKGLVMKETKGKANPKLVDQILRQLLDT